MAAVRQHARASPGRPGPGPTPGVGPAARRDGGGQEPGGAGASSCGPPRRPPSSTSTARGSRPPCWRPSSSASSGAPSPTPSGPSPGSSRRPTAGTLFLDEVGLLPAESQAKLLKVLEEGTVRRLGATRGQPVDVWIIAATSEDLEAAARERRFRSDLYHRLAVVTVHLPGPPPAPGGHHPARRAVPARGVCRNGAAPEDADRRGPGRSARPLRGPGTSAS